MLKIFRAGGAVILLLCFIFSTAEASLSPDIQKIKAKGSITVALVHEQYPPFFMKNSQGVWHGLDIEFAQRIAKELGVKLEFKDTAKSFDEAVNQVAEKKADLAICKLTSNIRRGQSVSFSKPYLTLNHAILINRIKNFDLNKEDIHSVIEKMQHSSATIAVVKGTSYVDYARHDFPNAQIIQYENLDQFFKAIVNGDVKFGLKDESDVKNWIHDNPENSIRVKVVLNKHRKDPISIAVPWDKIHLLEWLNLTIDVMNYDGSIEKLKKYYLEGFEWNQKK